ncbi:hypothetical protein [Desertibacillus haloalkaliphilus]|uniref:hypothetical protein n=1 Tax=Desertibacillus haloalkaliphilus TaxID=1328930 RepID=UPI001C278B7C|nr:hypothetical protein [Desertibacillus haloalkaliphilus]MBU8907233.1 hypothetical protein [Desertibacillus haloalkaliphilus]
MKKDLAVVAALAISIILLTGCLYPDERRVENQVPYEDQLQAVQGAVNQFQSDRGVLPIMTRDMETPIYQKYPIDFNQLVPRYLQDPPGNSFENGGVFQYVLVNPDTDPEVKLIDLAMMREIQEFQRAVNQYMRNNQYAPVDEVLAVGLFTLDYEELGYKERPRVRTRYFDNLLPLLIDNQGQVVIDYSIDLNMALQTYDHDYEAGDDIRELLVEHSPFVPAFSVPYTVDEAGEPTINLE